MRVVSFKKNEVIFRQGDNAAAMYDIVSGRVGIFLKAQNGEEEKLAELEADQIFGEMGLIEYYPRSATAIALTDDVRLMELAEADLTDYLRDKPEKLLRLMRQLSGRIRETTRKYADVCRVVSQNRRAEEEKRAEEQAELWLEMENYAAFFHSNWID